MMKRLIVVLAAGVALLGCAGGPAGAAFVCLNGSFAESLEECAGANATLADENASRECLLPPGLACSARLSKDGYLALRVKNTLPGEVVVTGLYCSSKARDVRLLPETEWTKLNRSIPQGGAADLAPVPCRNEAGENRQFAANESFSGALYFRHHFTITPEEIRIAAGKVEINAQ
ncbi:MAG: hypothetical protein QXH27_03535 [Candidatus Micrarchaeia archaeon]